MLETEESAEELSLEAARRRAAQRRSAENPSPFPELSPAAAVGLAQDQGSDDDSLEKPESEDEPEHSRGERVAGIEGKILSPDSCAEDDEDDGGPELSLLAARRRAEQIRRNLDSLGEIPADLNHWPRLLPPLTSPGDDSTSLRSKNAGATYEHINIDKDSQDGQQSVKLSVRLLKVCANKFP